MRKILICLCLLCSYCMANDFDQLKTKYDKYLSKQKYEKSIGILDKMEVLENLTDEQKNFINESYEHCEKELKEQRFWKVYKIEKDDFLNVTKYSLRYCGRWNDVVLVQDNKTKKIKVFIYHELRYTAGQWKFFDHGIYKTEKGPIEKKFAAGERRVEQCSGYGFCSYNEMAVVTIDDFEEFVKMKRTHELKLRAYGRNDYKDYLIDNKNWGDIIALYERLTSDNN